MPAPFYKKKAERLKGAVPLVAALGREPEKASSWRVRDSGQAPASTDLHNGVLAVPLTDSNEPCKSCKAVNHNDSIRTHEMIHVRMSPAKLEPILVPKAWLETVESYIDTSGFSVEVQNSIKNEDWAAYDQIDLIPVDTDLGVIAEEYLVERIHAQLAWKLGRRHDYVCLTNFKKHFLELAANKKYKDAVIMDMSVGSFYNVDKYVQKLGYGTYLGKYRKTAQAAKIKEFASSLSSMKGTISYWINRPNPRYTQDQQHEADRKTVQVTLWLYLRKLTKPQPPATTVKQLIDDGEIPEDLAKMALNVGARGGNEKQFAQSIQKQVLEKTQAPEKVVWGKMDIERPPLTKRMPLWKLQRKSVPSDEGTIPSYMHRYAIDQRVFRKSQRTFGASVLIDDSGSMHFTAKQIDEIMENIPGVIIAAYAGQHGHGTLKILAEKGKRVPTGTEKVGFSGNEVDRPALEWLAQQVEPRIWVSDGQVVASSGGYSQKAVIECMRICVDNKITRAENVTEAKLMLTGKKALQR